jgi:hypothetical protein
MRTVVQTTKAANTVAHYRNAALARPAAASYSCRGGGGRGGEGRGWVDSPATRDDQAATTVGAASRTFDGGSQRLSAAVRSANLGEGALEGAALVTQVCFL